MANTPAPQPVIYCSHGVAIGLEVCPPCRAEYLEDKLEYERAYGQYRTHDGGAYARTFGHVDAFLFMDDGQGAPYGLLVVRPIEPLDADPALAALGLSWESAAWDEAVGWVTDFGGYGLTVLPEPFQVNGDGTVVYIALC